METPDARPANRLIDESSPYLIQHAHNPVDWHPWCDEAFETARREDKPILLSIGYSACHWCHVMEHESFEDVSIARLMNENFVNIKVDREERPDVDSIYMNFVQMTTGSGGWPLTVFLTPNQVPFFGGTYFPPSDRYGRPGFPRILETLADAYRTRRPELEEGQAETIRRLEQAAGWNADPAELSEQILESAFVQTERQFDPVHGGFNGAPKFPSSMVLGFLLRHHKRTGSREALDAVTLSLDQMAQGGIYDQLGGGFHRYTVDERWLVPHFEKMAYDNALLVRLYLEAYQVTGSQEYRRVVDETLGWIMREMTGPEGGFFSALDADSEGEEGKFYVWTPSEVDSVLGKDASLFCDFYDVSASGNFEGQSILHHRYDFDHFAARQEMSAEELRTLLDSSRGRLLEERARRVAPGLDDKVLTAWNGLLLTAFAEAAWVLGRPDFLDAAILNARFLKTSVLSRGRLLRTWKNGQAKLNGYLEDYAFVIEGWLAVFQATGDVEWLDLAANAMRTQIDHFWDDKTSDFYFTSSDHEQLLVRQKEYLDNATPSGNAVSCLNLLKLSILLGVDDFARRAERMLERVGKQAAEYPLGFGYWLQALDYSFGPVQELVVLGDEKARTLLEEPLRETFLPNKILISKSQVSQEESAKIPLLKGKERPDVGALAFVCRNYSCVAPVDEPSSLRELLT